jgi:hypothetical protein
VFRNVLPPSQGFRTNSGSLAIFTAIRRASLKISGAPLPMDRGRRLLLVNTANLVRLTHEAEANNNPRKSS